MPAVKRPVPRAAIARERFAEAKALYGDADGMLGAWKNERADDEDAKFAQVHRMAYWAARKFWRSRAARMLCFDFDDLVQIASIGILRGIRTHGEDSTASLATWCANNALWKLRRSLAKVYDKWQRIGRIFEMRHGEDIELLLANLTERPTRNDPGQARALAAIAVGILRENGHSREADILEMRILEGRTLQEVGDVLMITRERVRQIQVIAAKRLKHFPQWRRELAAAFPDDHEDEHEDTTQ